MIQSLILQDDAGKLGRTFASSDPKVLDGKQPLAEQMPVDLNLPHRGSGTSARPNAGRAPRSLNNFSWHLNCGSGPGLENAQEANKPKISLLARFAPPKKLRCIFAL